jgi:predicted peptidase
MPPKHPSLTPQAARDKTAAVKQSALFTFAVSTILLAGCGGTSSPTSSPPPVTALPDYLACMSTTPVDQGSPDEPVITLNGPRVLSLPLGSAYTDAGATATDPTDGNITSKIVVTGLSTLDTSTAGDYLIRFNVTDSAQIHAREAVRVVRVTGGGFVVHTPRDIGSTSAHMAYYEHLPIHYSDDPNQKFPLIVFIHGWGHARFLDPATEQVPLSDLQDIYFDGLFDGATGSWDNSRPFIVLSPQKCVDALTYVESANRLKLFIDYAVNTYQVDPTRIYMGGHSEGSGDTWDYVTNYQQQLAAVFPISGPYGAVSGCELKYTPAWAFNGEADTTVPPQGQIDTVASINACDPPEPAKITIFPGADHNAAVNDVIALYGLGQGDPKYDLYNQPIYDWLLAHSRQ